MDDNDRRCVAISLERPYIWGILGWKRMKKCTFYLHIYENNCEKKFLPGATVVKSII